MTNTSRIIILNFLMMGMLFSCVKGDPVNNTDPRDLDLSVTISEQGSGKISISASAINTILYKLYIDSDDEALSENVSGNFEHEFFKSGIYNISVRAYGSSGRYIVESRQIQVDLENDVSVRDGYVSPLSYDGYDLVWNDEFEGTSIKQENWSFEIGTGCPNCGWGNNELQYYRKENAWVKDGVITIEAKEESFQGSNYTSARLVTKNMRSFRYGRIDIRALLPQGQGLWPALWMLGSNISSVSWPQCGEIDIMEMVGGAGKDNVTHGTIHWDSNGNHASTGRGYALPEGILADEYHVFSIIWTESSITWILDEREFYTVDISPADMDEFRKDFFFIMNVAVGGNWPGSPDYSTVFPQRMKVDYIRVFQKQN